MLQITNITSQPIQNLGLTLPDGSNAVLQIYFRPMQYGWFINSLTWNSFTLQGFRISNSPNMLRQWKNKLTFGMACFSTGNREPSLILDFSSGNSNLYILTAAEVQEYEEYLSGL